jgi:hypothetical protein
MRRFSFVALFSTLICVVPGVLFAAHSVPQAPPGSTAATATQWQSPARLRHPFTKTRGTLAIDNRGVEFRPEKGPVLHWTFTDIQSFHLAANRLDLETYQNRSWHFPGDREFHFNLAIEMPPAVAEQFARQVHKPVENGRPDPNASGFASLPARRHAVMGGTNGVLHFREGGIDYVTLSGRGSRSWRWSDIETIANPNPYHFRVQGYRETFEFELKQPMPRQLFDRLWDAVYARGLTGLSYSKGRRP